MIECSQPLHAVPTRASRVSNFGAAIEASGTAITPANHGGSATPGPHADLLVVGEIATNDAGAPTAEAMAISAGRIIGIGSMSDVEGLTNSATTTLKADGVVIPGLIEPHMHIWTSLINLDWIDLSHEACPTFDDAVATIKATAAKTPAGQYVLGKLFDPSRYPGEPPLTRAILDQAVPDHPVLVMNASQHYLYANSAALAAAGVTDATPDPAGGSFGRVDGKLNGIIGEPPAMMMMARFPKPSPAQVAAGVRQILAACASQGVTSMREAATGSLAGVAELAALHQINGAQRLPVRVSTAQFSIMAGKASPADAAAAWKAAGVTPSAATRWSAQMPGRSSPMAPTRAAPATSSSRTSTRTTAAMPTGPRKASELR
jgi:predicted amidohydrolase YtcJ